MLFPLGLVFSSLLYAVMFITTSKLWTQKNLVCSALSARSQVSSISAAGTRYTTTLDYKLGRHTTFCHLVMSWPILTIYALIVFQNSSVSLSRFRKVTSILLWTLVCRDVSWQRLSCGSSWPLLFDWNKEAQLLQYICVFDLSTTILSGFIHWDLSSISSIIRNKLKCSKHIVGWVVLPSPNE